MTQASVDRPKLQPLPRKLNENTIIARSPGGRTDGGSGGNKMTMADKKGLGQIMPRRIALRYSTKSLVLEYREPNTEKLRHRSFRIDVEKFDSPGECAQKLWRKISKVVVQDSLQLEQVKGLVDKLFAQKDEDAHEPERALEAFNQQAAVVTRPEPTPARSPSPDKAKPSTSLSSLAGLPTLGQQKTAVATNQPENQAGMATKERADTQQENAVVSAEKAADQQTSAATGGDAQSIERVDAENIEEDIPDYADDFEDDFEDREEQQSAARAEEERESLRLHGDDVDLQNIEEEKLNAYKTAMEEEFKRNAIKPGDPNWKHDVQVDFEEPEEDCGWDDEEEEDPENTF